MAVLLQAGRLESLVAQVSLFARIDARRPASWLMLAAAVACWAAGQRLERAGWPAALAGMAALVSGAVLAVGASGDFPMAACRGPLGGQPGIALVWLASRVAWPACGLVAAAAVSWSGPESGCLLLAAVAGLAAAAGTVFAGRWRGANAADAASLALTSSAAAGAAGGACASMGGMLPGLPAWGVALAVAVGTWFVIGLVALAVDRRVSGAAGWLHDGPPGPRLLRTWLTALAMGTALAAMVGWLFLDSSRAGLFPALALAWFFALAIPDSTLGNGVWATVGWRRLLRSATDVRPWWHLSRLSRGRPPITATLVPAAILGWPPLVAVVLVAGDTDAIRAASITVLGLAVAAAATVAIAWLLEWAGIVAESAQAVFITGLLAGAIVLLTAGCWPQIVGELPSLPGLPPPG